MSPKLFFSRLKTFLQGLTWAASPNSKIFGDFVYIVPYIPIQQIANFQSPCAFIIDNGAVMDSEHPGLLYQRFTLSIFVESVHSHMGEGILIGSNRAVGTSKGAGLFDIEDEVLSSLIETTSLTTKVMLLEKGYSQSVAKGNSPLTFRNIKFEVLVSIY